MIVAGFTSRCPGCDATIHDGDSIGLVEGEWCCEECVTDMGEDDDGA
jgi:hypothetical protein